MKKRDFYGRRVARHLYRIKNPENRDQNKGPNSSHSDRDTDEIGVDNLNLSPAQSHSYHKPWRPFEFVPKQNPSLKMHLPLSQHPEINAGAKTTGEYPSSRQIPNCHSDYSIFDKSFPSRKIETGPDVGLPAAEKQTLSNLNVSIHSDYSGTEQPPVSKLFSGIETGSDTPTETYSPSSPISSHPDDALLDQPSTSGLASSAGASPSDACITSTEELEESSQEQRQRKEQKCRMCINHNKHVKMKGHKGICLYINCQCSACHLTRMNQYYSRKRQKLSRNQQRSQKDDQQQKVTASVPQLPSPNALEIDFPRTKELLDQTDDILDYELFDAVNKYCRRRFVSDSK